MGRLDSLRIGWGICASYCNFNNTLKILEEIKKENAVDIIPILTENSQKYDTRFIKAQDFMIKVEDITGNKILKTLVDVEPLGPKDMIDIMVVLPCTGNTLAKLNVGIIDNTVLGAIKSIRRVNKCTVLAVSSNDLLGINYKNIAELYNTKHIYFVPMKMDNYQNKPNSIVADFSLLTDTIVSMQKGTQIQPVLL